MKLLAFLLTFAVHSAAKEKLFTYPAVPSQPQGEKTIDLDLMKEYDTELAQTKKELSSIRDPETLDIEISKKFQLKNQTLFSDVRGYGKPDAKSGPEAVAITKVQAQKILDKIPTHPVVSDKGSQKFDTPDRQIGYCFGKAAYVHVELLRHGVDPRSIAKMFAIGPLTHTQHNWNFHVATMVKAKEGGWWVIDGLESEVLTLEAWKTLVLGWSQTRKTPLVRFYFSDAVKLNPTPGAYSEKTLYVDYYKGFFKELGRWFQKNPVKQKEVFTGK
jgi:hypothetical protein